MKKSLLLVSALLSIATQLTAQTTCNQPVITEVKGAGTYCPGTEVTLEVTGTLNDATAWTWYSGSCGGTSLGTGTSIKVIVDSTATYFVRGTGACVGTTATCASVVVKYDDVGPEILTCPADILVANDSAECGAIVSFNPPTASDACSDTVFVKQVEGPVSGSLFPVGVTTITYELNDTIGNISTCSFTITVADEELPVINCPENIVANNDPGECGAIITYEVPVGSDNCPDAITELTEGLGSGAFFPVGVTTETYTVTDASGNTASCSFTITVKDVEPPVITLLDKETVLWPPNHKHHSIEIGDYIESVSDNCGGVTIEDVVIDEIGSDEENNGKGDGNTTDDIVITEDCRKANLLSERSGTGNGRVYVVTIALQDLHGNVGSANFIVEVPHDKGKKKSTIQDSIVYVVNGCDFVTEADSTTANGNSSGSESGRIERVEAPISVYPNPIKNTFSVSFTPFSNDYIRVELYNLMGQKIISLHEQDVEANINYNWNFDSPAKLDEIGLLIIWGNRNYGTVKVMKGK